jgi:putative endonuclease
MCYVYVLRGPQQLYAGSTNNLRRRFHEHRNNKVFSTKNRGPWRLVYYEASEKERYFFSISQARSIAADAADFQKTCDAIEEIDVRALCK